MLLEYIKTRKAKYTSNIYKMPYMLSMLQHVTVSVTIIGFDKLNQVYNFVLTRFITGNGYVGYTGTNGLMGPRGFKGDKGDKGDSVGQYTH